MPSRRTPRQLVVAVLAGVLIGGGLLAVTPAGAEVSQAAATSWKKIWKKELKQLADKRYYKKSTSDSRYAGKAEAAAAAAAAQAAANSATDSKLGGYYTKSQSDAKYAPYPSVIRGTYSIIRPATAVGQEHSDELSFGVVLPAAPLVHYIRKGTPVPAGCTGSAASPNADPGHLCVFESQDVNVNQRRLINATGNYDLASAFGASVIVSSTAAGSMYVYGSWAVRPGPGAVTSALSVGPRAGG